MDKFHLAEARLYRIWYGMKNRCYNPKVKVFAAYGGRGISICSEWLFNETAFYQWALTSGYDEGLQIDRIDVNGNYEPSNCRWVTPKENARNKRNTIYTSISGERITAAQLAEEEGLDCGQMGDKIKRGFTAEEAVGYLKLSLVARAELRRKRKEEHQAALRKILDDNYCFMEFIG